MELQLLSNCKSACSQPVAENDNLLIEDDTSIWNVPEGPVFPTQMLSFIKIDTSIMASKLLSITALES